MRKKIETEHQIVIFAQTGNTQVIGHGIHYLFIMEAMQLTMPLELTILVLIVSPYYLTTVCLFIYAITMLFLSH